MGNLTLIRKTEHEIAIQDNGKADVGLHILYNNAGLISKVSEEIEMITSAENCLL